MRTTALLLAFFFALPGAAPARHRHRRHHGNGGPPPVSQAGKFDYWVLSLSWSPEHCAEVSGGPDDSQCGVGRHYAFVVHGLWPQYENGGYPQTCSTTNTLSDAVVTSTFDIMPSADLIRHEWGKHGTCSGLAADAYFARARDAFHAINIPDRWQYPDQPFHVAAADVRDAFRAANPSLPAKGIAVVCSGHFFSEVHVCLGKKDLSNRACGKKVADDCDGQVVVRPVR